MKKPVSACWFALGLLAVAKGAVELPYRNEATRQLLIQTLRDDDRGQRICAVQSLMRVADGRNADELAVVAKDPVEAVRRQIEASAASSLGNPSPELYQPRPVIPDDQISETHRDPRIRQIARLRKLASDPVCKEDFSALLDEPDYFVRRAVSAQAVKSRGDASLDVWRKLAASVKLDDRVEAAWALGRLQSKADESTLIGFLDSDSERLRLIAIEGLQAVGGDATRDGLGTAVLSHTGKTQEALLRLAALLKAQPALPALRELAANTKATSIARTLSLDAIRAMADAEAKPLLMKMILDYDSMNSAFREHAAMALGVVGGPEAIPPLKRLITDKVIPLPMVGPSYDSDTTRIACLLALEQLKSEDSVKSLLDHAFLADASEPLRQALAESLSRLTGKPYDYRRGVFFQSHFIESLEPDEYPPDLAENLKKPPVFLTTP